MGKTTKAKSLKPRVIVKMNLGTRQHKAGKGTGGYSRKTKYGKPLDTNQ